MPSLFVIQGRDQGKRFELTEPAVHLGRDKGNEIQLRDTEVSRQHAEFRLHELGVELVDRGSSNGTFVNSQEVQQCVLKNGDRIQVGRSLMIFTQTEETQSQASAASVDIVGSESEGASQIIRTSLQSESGEGAEESWDVDQKWLARARSNLDVMYHTALAASHTLDIDQLLQRIMELIFEWVEADRGCVMLLDPETDELTPAARMDRRDSDPSQRMEISRTILDYVLQQKEGVLTSDARQDERWDEAASIVKLGVREAICVPLQGRYGVVGVIYIDTYTPPGTRIQRRDANRFNEDHLKLMVAIAHQAAVAIEDTNYYSAMVQAERLAAMGQTIATLSHHIKNILQGIRGGSYLIEEGLKSAENDVIRKGWSIVEKNQERISSLVMDMLSFSKEREPDLLPHQLNELVQDVLELVQARASDAEVQLQVELDSQMPVLAFDADAIHRAVLNVITNAVDACEQTDSAVVRVVTRYDEPSLRALVTVEDNGIGIPSEDLEKIFSVFESRKGNRGTGLGLAVSRKIFREHDGDIHVTSTVNEGSRFTLELPAVFPEPDAVTQYL